MMEVKGRRRYLAVPMLAIGVLCSTYMRPAFSADTRGDKQFSFTGPSASVYNAYPSDKSLSPELKKQPSAEAGQVSHSPVPSTPAAPSPGGVAPPGQQAGQAANVSRGFAGEFRAREGDMSPAYHGPANDGVSELKRGRITGQISNVPAANNTSPNGTYDPYGTGPIPLHPLDWFESAKVGVTPPP